jgi:hypothetical protein
MFGIRFIKSQPTTYLIEYKSGKIVRQGAGISFLYFAPMISEKDVRDAAKHRR